jgi:molybdopterin converting factor small subunit
MKRLFIAVLIAIGVYGYIQNNPDDISTYTGESIHNDSSVSDAYQNQLSDIQVNGSGNVSRILSDDNKGSRHQRFILRLSSGQTLLVAHNIDLAPKINTLEDGDEVQFFGEYEWNSKGGVIHWTHHDPSGRHVGGWLKHNGRRYE